MSSRASLAPWCMSDGASPFLRCIERLHHEAPAAPLVVLAPSVAEARTVRSALLRRKAARTGVWVTAPLQLARQIGRTHPSNRQGPLVTPEATREILLDALESLPDAPREAIAPDGSLDRVVNAMAPIVQRLRENDISPATLYALSIGRSVTPEQRALAAGYEAYDRHLLDGPHVGASDIFTAATAQIRTGRVTWLDDATVTAFDSVSLPETGATFVDTLRDAAPAFFRLGPSSPRSPAPNDTVAARLDVPRACAEEEPPRSKREDGEREIQHHPTDTLAAAAARIAQQADASSHAAAGDMEVTVPERLMDAARSALEQADLPVSTQPAAAGKRAPVLLTMLPAAGYAGRERLYIVTACGEDEGPKENGVTLLDDGDWKKLEGLTDTILPDHRIRPTQWHAEQIRWRHAGHITLFGPTDAWHDAFITSAE